MICHQPPLIYSFTVSLPKDRAHAHHRQEHPPCQGWSGRSSISRTLLFTPSSPSVPPPPSSPPSTTSRPQHRPKNPVSSSRALRGRRSRTVLSPTHILSLSISLYLPNPLLALPAWALDTLSRSPNFNVAYAYVQHSSPAPPHLLR